MTPDQYLDALLALPALSGALASPDGRWVAWTWYNAGPTADVFVVPTDGSTPPFRLTESPQDSTLVSWTTDSTGVLVAQDTAGDERDQLFRVDLAQPCCCNRSPNPPRPTSCAAASFIPTVAGWSTARTTMPRPGRRSSRPGSTGTT